MLILRFLLLQVRIHHPDGSIEGSISAYACSWSEWRKFLRSMYSVLCDDITKQTILKPHTLLSSKNNFTQLPLVFLDLVVEIFKQVSYIRFKLQNVLVVILFVGL